MDISNWPVKWLKVLVVFFGFILFIQLTSLFTAEDSGERLFNFIMLMVGAAVFGYSLLGLKFGFDREKEEEEKRRERHNRLTRRKNQDEDEDDD